MDTENKDSNVDEIKTSKPKSEVVSVEEVNDIKTETFRFEPAAETAEESKQSDAAAPKSAEASKTSDVQKPSAGNDKGKILKMKQPKKRHLRTRWIFCILIAAALVLAFVNRNKIIEYSEKNIVVNEEYEVNSRASFYINDNTLFYATKDGMKIRNLKNNSEISDTYTMTMPIMVTDGNYAAVAEQKGKQVRLYNSGGSVYNVACEGEIITFSINPMGYCAVCYTLSSDNSYTVDVYNETGVQLSHTKSTMENGMPVSVDLSDSGEIFAISFINTSELNLKSNILFYYPNAKDAAAVDNSDGMFSTFIFEDEVANKIHFLDNDDCIVLTDSRLVCYRYNGKNYSEKWNNVFGNYINCIDFPGNNSVVCGFGSQITSSSNGGYDKNTVVWYNKEGQETLNKTFGRDVTDIYSKDKAIIVGMSRYFEAYDSKNNQLWSYSTTQDVNNMQFYGKNDTVMIVTSTKMNVVNIKSGTSVTDDKDALEEEQNAENEKSTEEENSAQTTAVSEG